MRSKQHFIRRFMMEPAKYMSLLRDRYKIEDLFSIIQEAFGNYITA